MNINTETCTKSNPRKQPFSLKQPGKDGLLLKFHHTVPNNLKTQNIRFLQVSLNSTGKLLSAINHNGEIFVFDFNINKFWTVGRIGSCSVMKFSKKENELVVGFHSGLIHIIDIDRQKLGNGLKGHEYPVIDFSFTNKNECISNSNSEAIIWNLETVQKVQVLKLQSGAILKLVHFMPVSNNILACFQDDTLHIWENKTFTLIKQILPTSIGKISVKSISFTLDGRAMVIGGHSRNIFVFVLEIWAVVQTIALPDNIQSIKSLQFVSNPLDGGCNKVLSILSSNGVAIFYDMENDSILRKIQTNNEILRLAICPQGTKIACVVSTGFVEVFQLGQYKNTSSMKISEYSKTRKPLKKPNPKPQHKEIAEFLDINKLKGILKEFGEYPELYRKTIWTSLLQLPNNKLQYDAIMQTNYISPFKNLEEDYPMENKQDLKNLKSILNGIAAWCPFFSSVMFLPCFVYPFTRFYQNEPILCLEAIISIIVNYTQYWFEYHPIPPLNTLGMVENILLQHDPEVLYHLTSQNINSKLYVWPLLQTAFSEILSKQQWLIFWDHIISNEPPFLLFAAAAYSLIQKHHIVSLSNPEKLTAYFRSQNPIEFKRFISKIYSLNKSTSEENHPKRYLDDYKPIVDKYPEYKNYPKSCLEFNDCMQELKSEGSLLVKSEELLLMEKYNELQKLKDMQRNSEEMIRMSELQKLYQDKLNEERQSVLQQRERLQTLRENLHEEEAEILVMAREDIMNRSSRDNLRMLETLKAMEGARRETGAEVRKVEHELIEHYSKLLKHKMQIEKLMKSDVDVDYVELKKEYSGLADEIRKARTEVNSTEYLKQLNIATGVAAMDILINKVESELSQQASNPSRSTSSTKVSQLAAETKNLSKEINKLMDLLKVN